jgi:endonuclease-8
VIDQDGYINALSKLGPDPIKKHMNSISSDQFVKRVRSSSRSIAELLMDQSVIAGVGNVYRAELLFRAKLNPFVSGKSVPKEVVESIWEDAARLMPIGVRTGLMLTRDGFLSGKPIMEDRYYVYKREGEKCRECGGKVSIQLLAGRKLYWCRRCQK